jgi:Flp pilus assembly pilin Flp
MAERFRALRFFWSEEDGQDLIEYSLLIVFVAVACAAIVGAGGSATVPIWSRANTQLSAANATAS